MSDRRIPTLTRTLTVAAMIAAGLGCRVVDSRVYIYVGRDARVTVQLDARQQADKPVSISPTIKPGLLP